MFEQNFGIGIYLASRKDSIQIKGNINIDLWVLSPRAVCI